MEMFKFQNVLFCQNWTIQDFQKEKEGKRGEKEC